LEDDYGLTGYLKVSAIFVTILFSISSASILVLLSKATAVSCAFWRVFIASLILWTVGLLRDSFGGFHPGGRTILYSIVSGGFLAAHFLLWMESLFMIPVSVSTTVVVTYPLLSVLIDRLIFKEEMSLLQIVGLLLGFIGVLLFMHPYVLAEGNIYGVLFSFGGALCAVGYFSMGRFVRKRTSLLGYTVWAYTSASVILLFYASVSGENLFKNPPQTYIYFLLLALIPMIGGHTLINYVLKYMKTSVATSVALGEPIGASILAYLILQQQMSVPKALVMALVLTSIALTISQEMKRPKENPYSS